MAISRQNMKSSVIDAKVTANTSKKWKLMNQKTVEFLETLEGLLAELERRAQTDAMTMAEFRSYVSAMLEGYYRGKYD